MFVEWVFGEVWDLVCWCCVWSLLLYGLGMLFIYDVDGNWNIGVCWFVEWYVVVFSGGWCFGGVDCVGIGFDWLEW